MTNKIEIGQFQHFAIQFQPRGEDVKICEKSPNLKLSKTMTFRGKFREFTVEPFRVFVEWRMANVLID